MYVPVSPMYRNVVPCGPSLLNDSASVHSAPDRACNPTVMYIAMPSPGCGGPSCAQARAGSSPVWWRNRSTVWQAWCQSRWSVHVRGWPSAFLFSRRKNSVDTIRCCNVSSPDTMRRWTHRWLGLNRRGGGGVGGGRGVGGGGGGRV